MRDLLLRNGLVITPDGPRKADVVVVAGRVTQVAEDVSTRSAEELDCEGCWVGPGLVDLHAHFREPGEEWKEDIASGSAAAAAGGFTAVVVMPNTVPPIDAGHLARYVRDRGERIGLTEVVPAGCVSEAQAGERLAHLDEMWQAGVRLFTDDGRTVTDAGLLRRAMEYLAELGGLVAQHAEDPGLSRGHVHEGAISSRLGIAGIPPEAEEVVVTRDLSLVRMTGVRYHVQHVSSAGTVQLVRRAKEEGLPVTAEVTPHHLTFDHQAVAEADPAFKMYPPLRSEADRSALVEALEDGALDAVATDHAPHAAHETEVPFEEAPRGVIGLETAASAVHSLERMGPVTFFERMSVAPARIAGLPDHGQWPEPGSVANLLVFEPETFRTVDGLAGRARNSPFLGRRLRGAVRHTVLGGRVVCQDGKVAPAE